MPNVIVLPLPQRLLTCTLTDGELVPPWLSERDRPWLRDLLLEAHAFVGRPFAELVRRWRHSDPDPRAGQRLECARHVLLQWLRGARRATAEGRRRRELFAAAAAADPERALRDVASRHALAPAALRAALFDDLPHARRLDWPAAAPTPDGLLLATNRSLATGVLATAERAELQLCGGSRLVLRTAWLHGTRLVHAAAGVDEVRLHWQRGPHRRAARGLAALVPLLPWTRRFELRAHCRVHGVRGWFVLGTHDAILPGAEPAAFDSALERRFARDFTAVAGNWQLVREPVPLALGDQLAFPDFFVQRRGAPTGFWLEIAGLRDPEALPQKLALLANDRYVLCLPQRLVDGLAPHARIVGFTRRVDAAVVLARLVALDG